VAVSDLVPLHPESNGSALVQRRATVASRRVAVLAMALLTALALLIALQIWAWSGAVNADGISYMELGAQYARGDLSALANGYWSPLYPLLLGIAFLLTKRPAIDTSGAVFTPELRAVLATNVAIVLLATALYARLLFELDLSDASGDTDDLRMARIAAAGSLWIWWIVRFSLVTTTTPDLLLAACLAATSTELVIAGARSSRWGAVRMGIALAVGFWTKAAFFLVIPVAIVAYLLLVGRARARQHATPLILTAAVLSAPLVLVQSASQGHFSFGETGRLNYGWYVDDVSHGAPVVESRAESRARRDRPGVIQMDAAPGVVLYSGEPAASFPYWYDPSRYEPASNPKLSIGRQWHTLAHNARWFRVVGGAFGALCLLALAISVRRRRLTAIHLLVALPALALVALHALTHPEGRLVGSAIVCGLAVILFWRGRPRATSVRRAVVLYEAGALACIPLLIALQLGASDALRSQRVNVGPASALIRMGVAPRSRIGLIGSPYGHYWAHQLDLRISVVDAPMGARPVVDRELLTRIAEESCDRGAPLEAILWRATLESRSVDAAELPGGWLAWRPPSRCRPGGARSG
jgi:hypothetical protein